MKLTREQIKSILHGNNDWEQWVSPLQEILPNYSINTKKRIAMFMAQCGHESLNFKVLKENLNYSSKGLNVVFPKYFRNAGRNAQSYHREPEKIANVVYANRMRNGDVESGDGWKFSGKGVIQLTGRANTEAFAKSIGKPLEDTLDYLTTVQGALESACWFWKENNLNLPSDSGDIVRATKKINGGTIGLEDRTHHYKKNLMVLEGSNGLGEFVDRIPILLKIGSQGEEVRKVQEVLKITPDGTFGKCTEAEVMIWQSSKGLQMDGIVGPKTYKKMIG
tara:strand:+ start:806 stop:1639 length:834 start_codon:yes stop_codon:yes gene_type:complete